MDVIDFKGAYEGTVVDQAVDPALYERVLAAFDEAVLEDPHDTPEVLALLEPHANRVSWDAPIHSMADVDSMPITPGALNLKPSRFGKLERLFEAYEACEKRGLTTYGGGQFELGAGREQIQLLAALYHPNGSNDVAPRGYHRLSSDEPRPASPLILSPRTSGFALSST